MSDKDIAQAPAQPGDSASMEHVAPSESSGVATLNLNQGEPAPDDEPTCYVHIPPLLLRVMYQMLPIESARVRNLIQLTENWEDREQSDVGLLMLRLQLARTVFDEHTLPLKQLCQGLDFLGTVSIPKGHYTIHHVREQLTAASFKTRCLTGEPAPHWAFLGPGNWGPDGWLVLRDMDEQLVVLFVQSKKRASIISSYNADKLAKEAGKCWEVEGVRSCLLYLTDERGHNQDNESLEVGASVRVVPVSREAHLLTYGVALGTIKRCRDTNDQLDRAKKPRK